MSGRAVLLLGVGLMACPVAPQPDPPPRCAVTLSPAELDFGEVEPTAVARKNLTLSNSSNTLMHFRTVTPPQLPFQAVRAELFTVGGNAEHVITIQVRPADALLHLDALVLRSVDESCEFTVPLRALGSGGLRTEPETLTFELNPGEEQTKELLLVNSRREPVTVETLWRPKLSSGNPFTLTTAQGLTVPAMGAISLNVRANPTTWAPANVELLITAGTKTLNALVTQRPASPRFEVTPVSFDIPHVGLDLSSTPQGFVERTIRVRNGGTSGDPAAPRLRIEGVGVLGGDSRELVLPLPPAGAGLAEGESVELGVRIVPRTLGPRSYLLSVMANSFLFPPTIVQLEANAETLPFCTLQIDPLNALVLRDALDGGVEGSVTFTNASAERCIVDHPRLSPSTAPQLAIVAGAQSQVELPPQGVHQFTIAGPKPSNAGAVGAFGYHVLQPNHDVQWIELWVNP